MKTTAILISFLISASVLAGSINATCKARPESRTNAILLDSEEIIVSFDKKNVAFERVGCVRNEVCGECKMTGTFVKVTKNQSWMYDSSGLLDTADQTDYGYVYVSEKLSKGKNGTIAFSVRQLGDSEGAWWLTETFDCDVN